MLKEKIDYLIEQLTQNRFAEEVVKARGEYTRSAGAIFEDDRSYENRIAAFLEWYIFDRAIPAENNRTPFQIFLDESGSQLDDMRYQSYLEMRSQEPGIFEVRKIRDDHVIIENQFTGRDYKVMEKPTPGMFNKGELFQARILPQNGQWLFTGAFCFHPKEAWKFIRREASLIASDIKTALKQKKSNQSEIEKLDKRIFKKNREIDKLNEKINETNRAEKKARLDAELQSVTNEMNALKDEREKARLSSQEWERQKFAVEILNRKIQLMHKLNNMNQLLERSRNIAVNDIYK